MTADHVVVIGRGRLIAQMPIGEFTAQKFECLRSGPLAGPSPAEARSGRDGSVDRSRVRRIPFRSRYQPRGGGASGMGPLDHAPRAGHSISNPGGGVCGVHRRQCPVQWNRLIAGWFAQAGWAMTMTTTTVPDVSETAGQSGHIRFIDLLGSEWTKFTTVRSTVWTLLATAAVGIGLGRHRDLRPSFPLVEPLTGRSGCLRSDPLQPGRSALRPAGYRRARYTRHQRGVQHRHHPSDFLCRAAAAVGPRGQGRGVRDRDADRRRDRLDSWPSSSVSGSSVVRHRRPRCLKSRSPPSRGERRPLSSRSRTPGLGARLDHPGDRRGD